MRELKTWSFILSDECVLDKASFLIASVLPLGYLDMSGGENSIVIDLEDIKKHTNKAKEGLEVIANSGYGKWDKSGTLLTIGYSDTPLSTFYIFESIKGDPSGKPAKQKVNTPVKTSGFDKPIPRQEAEEELFDFSETIEVLNHMHSSYEHFCIRMKLKSQSELVKKKIKAVLDKAKVGKMDETGLLTYLACVNAMVMEWNAIPQRFSNIKERQMAKGILMQSSPDKLIRVIPYFVEHYPDLASEGKEDTNIYMLKFNMVAMARRMGLVKKNKQSKKNTSYGDDKL